MFLLAGAVLTVVGVPLASGAVLIPGVVVLLFALLYGIGASGCISADQLAGWPSAYDPPLLEKSDENHEMPRLRA